MAWKQQMWQGMTTKPYILRDISHLWPQQRLQEINHVNQLTKNTIMIQNLKLVTKS
jgi:hypothetical protein